jgi:hypothetical protein
MQCSGCERCEVLAVKIILGDNDISNGGKGNDKGLPMMVGDDNDNDVMLLNDKTMKWTSSTMSFILVKW